MKTNFITLLLLLTGLSNAVAQITLTPDYEANSLLVYFDENTSQDKIDLIRNEMQAEELWISPLSSARYWYFSSFGYTATIDGIETTINDVTHALEGILKLAGSAGDQHDDTDGVGLSFTSINQPVNTSTSPFTPMSCEEVVDLYANFGPSTVNIAINDSGYTPELSGSDDYPYNPNINTVNEYIDSNNGAIDQNGHGTHILGVTNYIINHDATNDNNQFQFAVNRILDNEGRGSLANLIYSVENAIIEGNQIINLSLSIISDNDDNPFLNRMVDQVELTNTLLVIAAGNNSANLNQQSFILPASMQSPNIITVGSSTCLLGPSYFTNYGINTTDIMAPGDRIIGYDNNGDMVVMTGTSQATAIVTGIAALVASHQRQFDAPAIKCAILEGAQSSNALSGYNINQGIVDANGAITALKTGGCGTDLIERSRKGQIENISVSPNPFDQNILIESPTNISEVYITDLLGNLILNEKYFNQPKNININSEFFPSGIYIVNVIKENKTKEIVKLIKS